MGYTITFADVMAGVITLALGLISYFIKNWFADMGKANEKLKEDIAAGNKEIQEKIDQNDKKVTERIDKLEEKTMQDIERIKQKVNDMKSEMPTVFVLREDFFRSMNRVEDSMNCIDKKIDKLLTEKGER